MKGTLITLGIQVVPWVLLFFFIVMFFICTFSIEKNMHFRGIKKSLIVAASIFFFASFFIVAGCGNPSRQDDLDAAAKEKARQDSIAAVEFAEEEAEKEKEIQDNCYEEGRYYAMAEHNGFSVGISDFHYQSGDVLFKNDNLFFSFNCFNNGSNEVNAFKVRVEFYNSVGKYANTPCLICDFSKNCKLLSGEKQCDLGVFSTEKKNIQSEDPLGEIKAYFLEILYGDGSRYRLK